MFGRNRGEHFSRDYPEREYPLELKRMQRLESAIKRFVLADLNYYRAINHKYAKAQVTESEWRDPPAITYHNNFPRDNRYSTITRRFAYGFNGTPMTETNVYVVGKADIDLATKEGDIYLEKAISSAQSSLSALMDDNRSLVTYIIEGKLAEGYQPDLEDYLDVIADASQKLELNSK